MNISYNWLKDLIDIDAPAPDLAAHLTRVGLAVEGLHPHGDDFIMDIDLTSNRPDCLSHFGIAREISVITGGEFPAKPHSRDEDQLNVPYPAVLAGEVVKVDDAELCPRFTARIIKNVKVGPSPNWLVGRLEAVGDRSINNIADITNYVMLELGQPMHAFDLDKLAEKRIVVRRAKTGDTITTLDEVERQLDDTILAICDASKPVAIAGIMGGLNSSISNDTVNVLLEVACFKRENIRATSRSLNLATEASYRFERGVDIENVVRASDRALELILEFAGGEAQQFVDVYSNVSEPASVASPNVSASVKRLTGLDIVPEECDQILKRLRIEQVSEGLYNVPSWRHDVSIEEDLVEEIARHAGYEKILDELPPTYGAGEYQTDEIRKRVVRRNLAAMGFDEALSYSFIDVKYDGLFETIPELSNAGDDDNFVTLRDSVIESAVRMRPTLLPGLLHAMRLNLNQQRRDIRLFEIGKAFAKRGGQTDLPTERELFALVMCGDETSEGRVMPVRNLDFYDAKGALDAVFDSLGVNSVYNAAEARHMRLGQSASVSLDSQLIGFVGRLSEETAANYKFKQPVYVAEIDLRAALAAETEAVIYRPLSKYPAVSRDVSFLTDRNITFASIREAAIASGTSFCRRIEFVDVFEGKGLDESQRSITVRFEYRSEDRTLVEDEVNMAHASLLENLENTLGIRPRV